LRSARENHSFRGDAPPLGRRNGRDIQQQTGSEMEKNILLVIVGKRKEAAVKVQQILTAWGCLIKTRLGIHDGVLEDCADEGLLICEIVGKREEQDEMARKLELLPDVTSKLVRLEVPTGE